MSSWIVEMVDAGCDCCSFVPVAQFYTKKEALAYVGDDENLVIYKEDEDD